MRRWLFALIAGALSLTLGLGTAAADDTNDVVDVSVVIPASERDVDDAVLSWALNPESGSGAFYGGCNFLSAGIAGDAGSSRVWLERDGFWRATHGNVSIEKPTSATAWTSPTWADRCINARTGEAVTTGGKDYGTGNRFVITAGSGTVDVTTNSAKVAWQGSVTVAMYGGLTYFWLTDPVLSVSNGTVTLTATLGGYGADQSGSTRWEKLEGRTVTLANLTGVDLASDLGFTADPAYRGVSITVPDGAPEQARTGGDWGSFPQSFVNYVNQVGQAAYWYSSGGARDFAKPPTSLAVSWSADDRVDGAVPTTPPRGDGDDGTPGGGPSVPSGGTATPSATAGSTRTGAGSSGGSNGSSAPAQAVAATAAPQAATAADAGWSVAATTPDALLSTRGLIPAAAAALEDPRALLVIASSAFAALAAIAGVGFRRRWFVLPWSKG